MELEGRAIVLYVTSDGFGELNFLLNLTDEHDGVSGLVRSTDGFGISLSVTGEQWRRVLLVPWPFIRALEL